MLPTDVERRLSELIQVQEIIGIKRENGQILVQASMGGDHKSPWMPYSLPFMGNTAIFAYPKIGMGGLVVSESGENEVNRFLCLYDIANIFGGLGETDFKILFHNGDSIHHAGNNLQINVSNETVINSTAKTVVNSQEIITNSDRITLNASSQAIIKSPIINLNGNVFISGGLSAGGGMGRSSLQAVFNYPVVFNNTARFNATSYSVEMIVNGIPLTTHKHDTPEGMSDVME